MQGIAEDKQDLKKTIFTGIKDADWLLIQRKTGITKTSVRRWKAGKLIKKRYFETIAECLKIDVKEVENYNKELLRKQGRIKVCDNCKKEYEARFYRTKACSAICRNKLIPKSEFKLKMDMHFKKDFIDALDKDETRSLIRSETDKFLNNGSKIKKLKAEEAYFTFDSMSWDLP